MKSKITKVLVLSLLLIMLFGTITASAFNSYDTYTYSIDGEPLKSPPAYNPYDELTSEDMSISKIANGGSETLGAVSDIVTDSKGNVYVADPSNNRIVVLNKYYTATNIITSYYYNGQTHKFNKPQGVYAAELEDGYRLYVCDTENKRIVIFDENYECLNVIDPPTTELVPKAFYTPIAIAVDKYGRMFVVSPDCADGIIVMSSNGDFNGLIGAQKVTPSILEAIWRRFQSEEQRRSQAANISSSYNNITVDEYGFVYVTIKIKAEDQSRQMAALKSKKSDYSPIKKLNSAGVEIMKRNGFFDPGGEVVSASYGTAGLGVSSIIDVAVGDHGTWSIIDEKRSRIFTYDQNGNLLFAFGDKGDQFGNIDTIKAITYQTIVDENDEEKNYLLAIDSAGANSKLVVYAPTQYCDTIMSALACENSNDYDGSMYYWEEVLKRNNNFDLAYIGIGKALYNKAEYDEAMEMFKYAYETTQYSKAFAEMRKGIIGRWLLPIAILVIAVVVLFLKLLGWAKKKNKATALKVGKRTFGEELVYAFYVPFHPFDSFYDLKHEKRGSVKAGLTIMGITIVAFFYQAIGRGYMFNPRETYSSIFTQVLSITVPVLLWCVGNWCLTTLFDGEGGFRDIFIATTYALAPLPLFVIISTVLTNVLTVSEGSIVSLLLTLGYIWVGFLLFFGMLVTHDYTLKKNILITLCTILAMVVIMFVIILFSSLVLKMVTFVSAIIQEIASRA